MSKKIDYLSPKSLADNGSPVVLDYAAQKYMASQLIGHVKVKVNVATAIDLSQKCSYPSGVKLAIMKQVANTKEITLQQLRVLFGWAADKAMR